MKNKGTHKKKYFLLSHWGLSSFLENVKLRRYDDNNAQDLKIIGLVFGIWIFAYTGSFSQSSTKVEGTPTISILFVGNSLTYTHNLPKLVMKAGKQKGVHIDTKMIAYPNYALEDHWHDGQVQALISSEKFDFVIMQQGPSSQTEGRQMLIEYGEKFSRLCELHDVQPCYFMVWPSLRYYHTFEGVIKNYTDAAVLHQARLIPVGKVWKAHVETADRKDYYSADGFHPSRAGSQLAAEVMVEYLLRE